MKLPFTLSAFLAVALVTSVDVQPQPSTSTPPTTETTTKENSTESQHESDAAKCSKMIGIYIDGVFKGPEINYDLAQILKKHGGSPGKLNVTWTKKEDAPVNEEYLEKRPLPDADEKYWVYKYGDTDSQFYIRIEHAVHRFSGTPKEFLEIRGQIYFTPDDFCGKMRRADYVVDDRGFTYEFSHDYCWIGGSVSQVLVSCASPGRCTNHEDGTRTCVAAPGSALLSALVGGGK